ncbi:hypothetical protein [Pseudemcibacter aquimaris]|uniref:hypothetical protein n=1 Tax=Pseudemcibacter aquimaris TaxID=2857064 RepID=UPI00201332EA|nr:hypothetical protein [Pseudemcibacter aquimaris]MCC3862070.1 hypothetical protein [Pseudemcibacter aquimaris]WDU58822.1 hypothetical protein KW060_00860 [Pseudemcibacter aquimaris]
MSLGLVHRKEVQKRRKRRLWAMIKFVFVVGLCGGIGYYAHEIGLSVAQEEVLIWQTRYENQAAENEKLKVELGQDKAELDQMKQLLPNEDMRNVIAVVTAKANEGVDLARMENIISGISKDATCDAEIDSKRFMVLTPVSPDEVSTASYYRGLITVSGTGSSVMNENGAPEAWFDPAKEVFISFMMPGGEKQDISGTLPLYHSVITGGSEYRFSITAGRTSFADASVQRCDL